MAAIVLVEHLFPHLFQLLAHVRCCLRCVVVLVDIDHNVVIVNRGGWGAALARHTSSAGRSKVLNPASGGERLVALTQTSIIHYSLSARSHSW